jgi:hypothetical protein
MHDKGHANTIRSALSATTIIFAAFLFVDDTDLFHFAEHEETTPMEVVQQMQDGVEQWQGALRASGGALKPEKCSWCLVGYRFKANGCWEYHSQESLPAELRIHNPEGELVALTRLEPSESITVVGMVQAMDGGMEGQVNEL